MAGWRVEASTTTVVAPSSTIRAIASSGGPGRPETAGITATRATSSGSAGSKSASRCQARSDGSRATSTDGVTNTRVAPGSHSNTCMFQFGTCATLRYCRSSVTGRTHRRTPERRRNAARSAGVACSKRRTVASYSAGQRYGRSYDNASRTRHPEGAIGSSALSSMRPSTAVPSAGICHVFTASGSFGFMNPRTRPPMYTRCGPADAVYQAGGASFASSVVGFRPPLAMSRSATVAMKSAGSGEAHLRGDGEEESAREEQPERARQQRRRRRGPGTPRRPRGPSSAC